MTTPITDAAPRDPEAHDGQGNAMPNSGRPGKRVFIETYGCQMNLADSELMGGVLASRGYARAESVEEADVILLNTCAVREKAEERIYGRLSHLLRLKNDRPEILLGVTGCMAEHLREDIIDRAPYVDLVIGPDAYRRLPELLENAQEEGADPQIDIKLDKSENYEDLDIERQPGVGAWITVQRGCDKFCTFCIVPFTRGRERGVHPNVVLAQCEDVAARGYREVTLLGQTVNSYVHPETGTDFADLVARIADVDGIERIRFTSPYPTDFTPKLIATMAASPKVCKYLHMPVQSGSDRMLELMRRQYTRAEYDQLVLDIRAAMPDIAMSTDVIVGYPGETEEDFEQTYRLLEQVRYDFAYLFKYSERSGTFAARNVADDVPEEVKKERLKRVIALQESISAEIFTGRIGGTYRVMVEGESRRDSAQLCGRTDDFKMAVFDKPADRVLKPGDFVDVVITDATSHTLIGKVRA